MSSTASPVKLSKFDFKKVSFSAPRNLGDKGGKILYLNYDNAPLSIKTPEINVAWDVKYYEDPAPESGKYSVSVKFDNLDDKSQSDMHSVLNELDNVLLKSCYENRAVWLKKAGITEEGIKLLYTPLIKRSVDKETGEVNGKWPDGFRFKMSKWEGVHQFKMFDEDNKLLDLTEIDITEIMKKGSKVKAVLRCNGVWILGGKFGCTWKAQQLKVEAPKKMKECAFESDDDDSDDDGGDKAEAEADDSDDDSDSSDSD